MTKLGNDHPDTLISIGSLGLLLKDLGELEEARLLYEESLFPLELIGSG